MKIKFLVVIGVLMLMSYHVIAKVHHKDSLPDSTAHNWVAFHFGLSQNNVNGINSWLLQNGYPQVKNEAWEFGIYEIAVYKHGYGSWGFDVAHNFSSSDEPTNISLNIGEGIKIFAYHEFRIYTGLQLGLLATGINFNNTVPPSLKNYNLPKESGISNNSMLISPHILLMRILPYSVVKQRSFFKKVTFGIEAGYHINALLGRWQYGVDSNNNSPNYGYYTPNQASQSVTVRGIPHAGLKGFYALLQFGWFIQNN
jgi:hypothetical protein